MAIKDFIKKIADRKRRDNQLLDSMEKQVRFQKIVEERQKSSNERELERYIEEDREEQIKEMLERKRQERDDDIRLGHNPLDVKNITSSSEFEVLKEKNQFANSKNIFQEKGSIHKNNPNLFKNN